MFLIIWEKTLQGYTKMLSKVSFFLFDRLFSHQVK